MMGESPGEELSAPLLAGGDGIVDPENPADKSPVDGHDENGAPTLPPSSSTASTRGSAPADVVDFESHFTLRIPTSTVHFRGSILRVIDTDQDQIILQQRAPTKGKGDVADEDDEDKRDKVLVKRLSPGTYAQRFLRAGYTLITVLFLGFLFVFCFQVLLFLFIGMSADSGYTTGSGELDGLSIVSGLLAFPVMLYGMASLMAMGSAFVIDTYNGASLFRSTIVEILYMCVFLVVPILTFAISLMAHDPEPWRRAAAVWAIAVLITFCAWGLAVSYKQVKACFWLVERRFFPDEEGGSRVVRADGHLLELGQDERTMIQLRRLGKIANKALLLTQTARYAGTKKERFNLVAGADVAASQMVPLETHRGLYSRLTAVFPFAFDVLDAPKRIYSGDEVRDILPFMTKNNFSMLKLWCAGDSRHRNVVVARGPSALTYHQIKYSVFCTLTSSILFSLLLIGALVWLDMGVLLYVLVVVILLLCCIAPVIHNALETYRLYGGVHGEAPDLDTEDPTVEEEERDDEANLFQVWETFRVTQPKPGYCYARVAIEVVFLFLWPWISMFVKRNYPVALVFFVLGGFTFLWRYFDTLSVLSELGSMSDVVDETVTHQQMYRMSEVIGRVITNKGRKWWSWIFAIFFLAILVLSLASSNSTDTIQPGERGTRPPILLVDDFSYPPQEDTLAYPTCKLTKGFEFPGGVASDLGDYSFLSAMAYETARTNNYTLAKWFGGPNVVVDEEDFVSQWRKDSGTATSPVSFKLFSISAAPGYAIMSIRGSETMFDWLSNMQLWSAAGLAQVVKWLTPFGWVWEPILPDLIYLVNKVESEQIASVSYYRVTTQFVDEVLGGYGGGDFSNLHVTGVSLGGGLAIITGAQTDANIVAFSGMGATLSRETFDPPIQLEKLNAQTFNFIPERDYIARIGGRAPLFQNAQCIAPNNDLFGCHNMWRSICEIAYRCGSNGRPVPCRCVDFGYPIPTQNGTRSFEEACQEANSTWYEVFPPN